MASKAILNANITNPCKPLYFFESYPTRISPKLFIMLKKSPPNSVKFSKIYDPIFEYALFSSMSAILLKSKYPLQVVKNLLNNAAKAILKFSKFSLLLCDNELNHLFRSNDGFII